MKYMKKNTSSENKFIITATMVFVILMLFASGYTSPLYPHNFGSDSAIFSLMGKALARGKNLYVDLFDHKGPVLFFINALGYLGQSETSKVWYIQCILGVLTLACLYHTCKLIRIRSFEFRLKDMACILGAGYILYFYLFERGNLSEEYSLPFIAVSLLLFVKYAVNAEVSVKHPYRYAFIYGISFALIAFIRLNNALTICAGILTIGIYLLAKKEYKNFFFNVLYGIAGFLMVAIPIILFFYSKDALFEMLYATFIYNFKYASITGHASVVDNLPLYVILYFPVMLSIGFICCWLIKRRFNLTFLDWIILSVLGVNVLSLFVTNLYPHYFSMFVPVYMMILSRTWNVKKREIQTLATGICFILYLVVVLYSFSASFYRNYVSDLVEKRYTLIHEDMQKIPEDERDSIIGYNIDAADYLRGNIIPCYKYYTYQEWWSQNDPSIRAEFMDWLKLEEPLWIITKPDEDDEDFIEHINETYELKFENEYMNFYRLYER